MEPEVVMGYSRAILTPNAAEFQRLHEKVVSNDISLWKYWGSYVALWFSAKGPSP